MKKGSTVTVFAPYDCNNGCPFCVNKAEYVGIKYDVERTIESMWKMHAVTPECDFVFTGGEPLADIPTLWKLLAQIKAMNKGETHHNLFINTTFPNKEAVKVINFWKDTITGLNISRHLKKYVKEIDDEFLNELEVPVRINCVLYEKDWTEEQLEAHLNRFKDYKCVNGFQFRDNYVLVNRNNLFNRNENENLKKLERGLLFYKLRNKPDWDFNYYCHEETFRWDVQLNEVPLIKFHRTLPFSKLGNEINDVIINQEGYIYDDWNGYGKRMDFEEYKRFLAV